MMCYWLKKIFRKLLRLPDIHVLVLLPNHQFLWLLEEEYINFLTGNYAIVWLMNGETSVVPTEAIARLQLHDIYIWTTEARFIHYGYIRTNRYGWPFSSLGIYRRAHIYEAEVPERWLPFGDDSPHLPVRPNRNSIVDDYAVSWKKYGF
jgi:hypothetical protein